MKNEEYLEFLRSVLIKIENVNNLLGHKPVRHIPAYHKMLGVQQKLGGLSREYKNRMFHQLVGTRSILHYFLNGNYCEGKKRLTQLKKELIIICLDLQKKNENNKV